RNHAQRTGHECLRIGAQPRMAFHVLHFAVVLLRKPVAQVRCVLADLEVRNANLLEAKLTAPLLDEHGERVEVVCRHARMVAAPTNSVKAGIQRLCSDMSKDTGPRLSPG